MNGDLHLLTNDELHTLQKIELEMLLEIDRICRENGINYSIDGGTLLGAVRHKGFIPWDDDADVVMLRHEYARFKRACRKDLDTGRFFLQDYRTDPEYRWGYAKLRRNDTSYIRAGQENQKYRDGVFLDIFVVDNVPDNLLLRKLHYMACFVIRKGLYSTVGKYNEKNPFIRTIYSIMSRIPKGAYFKVRNIIAGSLHHKRTELISHYGYQYPARCRYGLPRECFDEMTDMIFEGYPLRGFVNYDLYLTRLYGDYMKLPPKSEQYPKMEITSIKLIDPILP